LTEERWAAVGKAAAVATIIGTAIALLTFFGRPAPDVVAELRVSEFLVPPTLMRDAQEFLDQEDPPTGYPQLYVWLADRLASYGSVGSIRAMWRLELRNEGRVVARAVSVQVPGLMAASVRRPTGDVETIEGEGGLVDVGIGDLRPQESVTLLAWVRSGDFAVRDLRVLHEDGVAPLRTPPEVSRFWARLQPLAFLLFYLSAMGVLMLVVLIKAWLTSVGEGDKSDELQTDKAVKADPEVSEGNEPHDELNVV
jgi:hypothetical protein